MLRKTVVVHIPNEHLNNTATFFIKKANEFSSHITVSRANNSVNAKSLLGVLSLGRGSLPRMESRTQPPTT